MNISHPDVSALPSTSPSRLASDIAVFSDDRHDPAHASTPPSSPPGYPWDRHERQPSPTPSAPPPTKSVFSVLGKRKPLTPTSNNARSKKRQKPADVKSFTQMQMSLGQKIQTKCKTCGMEYVASSAEDRKLHDKFHKQSQEGIQMGQHFITSTSSSQLLQGLEPSDAIVELDIRDHGRRKNIGQAALEVVQMELGAVPIPKEDIWGIEKQPLEARSRYRSYLYIRETSCIGYLLVEEISEAYRVVKPDTIAPQDAAPHAVSSCASKSALEALKARKKGLEQAKAAANNDIEEAANHPIQLCKTKRSATMGVSRIWTSSAHRGQGIAVRLINTAVKCWNKRLELQGGESSSRHDSTEAGAPADVRATPHASNGVSQSLLIKVREQVAFSQPTDSGARLARKWFGKAYGWSVYVG